MGQNQDQNNNNKNVLTINEQLTNIIKEEIKPKINSSFKNSNFFKYSQKRRKETFFNKINNNSDDENDEEDNELNLKSVANLVDLIYSKNINTQLKHRANKSVYETIFDVRNIMDLNEDLNNNEYNIKTSEIMKNIIEPEFNQNTNKIINNNDNNDEENNDDYYYTENDFFKNWDYHDDIFKNDFQYIENNEEEKDNEENENNNILENEEKINNNININNEPINDFRKQFEIKKDNNIMEDNFEVKENKDNTIMKDSFKIIENNDINFTNNKNGNMINNIDINQSEMKTNNIINGSKYYKDSDDIDELDIGNNTKKSLFQQNSSSEDSTISPIKNYNHIEKDSSEDNEHENSNIQFKYNNLNDKNKNNYNITNTNIIYTKKKINPNLSIKSFCDTRSLG